MPGIKDIYRMTAPLGYTNGGITGYKEGTRDGTLVGDYTLTREDVDLLGIDPSIIESGENIISKNSDEYRKLMEIKPVGVMKGFAQDLFGGLGKFFRGKKAEGSTLVDFLKSKRARLMSEVQGEMQGTIYGTGVNEGRIKILRIEIDKLTEQLNDLGEN